MIRMSSVDLRLDLWPVMTIPPGCAGEIHEKARRDLEVNGPHNLGCNPVRLIDTLGYPHQSLRVRHDP
jgi:hypothetical protein